MNVTIDDTSPRIQYYSSSTNASRRWARDNSGDESVIQYLYDTFAMTTGEGDRMVFTFNGSAIWVYGSKWFNHGAFSARLDDGPPIMKTGISAERVLQTILYQAEDLDVNKEHTITLTNLPSASQGNPKLEYYLDIDYIMVQQPVTQRIYTTEIDDFDPMIKYSTLPPWQGVFPSLPVHHNLTQHVSNTVGSTAVLLFNGTAVEIFGSLDVNHGNYSVAIDGVNKGIFNGSWITMLPDVSLFSASGLRDTQHNLSITNLGGPYGNVLDIDQIRFNSTTDPYAKPSSAVPITAEGNSDTNKKTGGGLAGIVGGVVGGLAVLALIGCLLFWLHKRKNQRQARAQASIDLTGDEVKPYRSVDDLTIGDVYYSSGPQTLSAHTLPTSTSSTGGLLSAAPRSIGSLPLLNVPLPPGSDASSYRRSTAEGSHYGSPVPSTSGSPDRDRRNPFHSPVSINQAYDPTSLLSPLDSNLSHMGLSTYQSGATGASSQAHTMSTSTTRTNQNTYGDLKESLLYNMTPGSSPQRPSPGSQATSWSPQSDGHGHAHGSGDDLLGRSHEADVPDTSPPAYTREGRI